MPERNPDFERLIDENPLESTTHMIYADWLDDHGEHDEAAFRRSLGNWINSRIGQMSLVHNPLFNAPWSIGVPREDNDGILPQGVRGEHIEWTGRGGIQSHPHLNVEEAVNDPNIAWMGDSGQRYFWRTYRGMEEGLRRAFLANRRRQQPEQLSRISRSVRKLRRR